MLRPYIYYLLVSAYLQVSATIRSKLSVSAGNVSIIPPFDVVTDTAAPVGHMRAFHLPAPSAGSASVGSFQSSTCTNTVSPRCVVTPQLRGAIGPARVP